MLRLKNSEKSAAVMLVAAKSEQSQGQYENAFTAYKLALGYWLREKWVEHSGERSVPYLAPGIFITKLKHAGKLDNWVIGILKNFDRRPCPVERKHAELIGTALCLIIGDDRGD